MRTFVIMIAALITFPLTAEAGLRARRAVQKTAVQKVTPSQKTDHVVQKGGAPAQKSTTTTHRPRRVRLFRCRAGGCGG